MYRCVRGVSDVQMCECDVLMCMGVSDVVMCECAVVPMWWQQLQQAVALPAAGSGRQ